MGRGGRSGAQRAPGRHQDKSGKPRPWATRRGWQHPAEPLRAPHLAPEQLRLRQPGALDLVAHAAEERHAVLVLVEAQELRQDLPGLLWRGGTNTGVRPWWTPGGGGRLPAPSDCWHRAWGGRLPAPSSCRRDRWHQAWLFRPHVSGPSRPPGDRENLLERKMGRGHAENTATGRPLKRRPASPETNQTPAKQDHSVPSDQQGGPGAGERLAAGGCGHGVEGPHPLRPGSRQRTCPAQCGSAEAPAPRQRRETTDQGKAPQATEKNASCRITR